MAVFDRLLPRRQASANAPEDATSLLDLRNDFHRAIDEVFRRAWEDPSTLTAPEGRVHLFHPRVDLNEDDDALFLTAELPGMQRQDIDLRVEGNAVVLRGEKRTESETEERGWHRSERSYGSFMRRVTLPVEIKPDKVQATFRDGVLEVKLPKSDHARSNAKRIQVKG